MIKISVAKNFRKIIHSTTSKNDDEFFLCDIKYTCKNLQKLLEILVYRLE